MAFDDRVDLLLLYDGSWRSLLGFLRILSGSRCSYFAFNQKLIQFQTFELLLKLLNFFRLHFDILNECLNQFFVFFSFLTVKFWADKVALHGVSFGIKITSGAGQINLLAFMLPMSFHIFLRNFRHATVSKWAGKWGFLVASHQMRLGLCVSKLYRASLALENCRIQHFHDYIVAPSWNEGFFAIWTASFLTYPGLDAFITVELIAFAAFDHVFNYLRANSAGKFCNQLLIKGLVWWQISLLGNLLETCVSLFLIDLIKLFGHILTI